MHCSWVSISTVYYGLTKHGDVIRIRVAIFSPHLPLSLSLFFFFPLAHTTTSYIQLSVSDHNGCFISCCIPYQYAVIPTFISRSTVYRLVPVHHHGTT